ncbi:hypothetical protein OSB04_001828 [Centaurea solstitialis]|uniref:Retrotransposon gag domain-containing protein n=1 Tax=Centaurea solstitialis TaxID=347529 RepID=A0AA38WLS3_9ASTR|nr:hypothetical protein OSB04_001828 [Centaurea solstitialis]
MVVTRRTLTPEEPETSDLGDVIGPQITETLHQILPGLFAQMKDELLAAVDERIEAAFTARGSGSGSTNQGQSRASTFKDFMACQPPDFEGKKDTIACYRWVAAVEGAFRTSGCPDAMKVVYAVNLLRNAGKDWWGLILKSRTEEQIGAMTWEEFKELLDEKFSPRIEKERITAEFLNLRQTTETRQKTRASKTTAAINFHAPDGSHVFTSFTNDPTLNARKKEEYRDIVNRLLPRQILMPKRVDWDLLRSMHIENDIKAILEKHAYDEDGNEYYICHAWERVFDIAETLYRELIVEFVATFRFDAIKALDEFHQSCMTFRLGGICRSFSLVEFALALGIYTQADVDAPGFEEYMWATSKRSNDFDPRLAWAVLGDGDYHGNLKVKGFVVSTDRLLHRMLIQAVNARSSSEEKVTVQDLWLFEQLSTDDKYPNAPYLIAAQLAKASGYREGSRIVGGQYVTLLAKHFGILTDAAIASMTNLGEMGLIDMDQLRGMGVARVEHAIGRDYNAWIRNPQSYRSQPRSQPSQAPRSTHETGGTSGASSSQQLADWTAYAGYQDLSNQLSEMSLSYGRHQQHTEYNTVEALHQANWQSGVMNQMASHFGIQPNTAYAPSPYWPYSEDAPPGYPTYEDWQNQPRGPLLISIFYLHYSIWLS